MHDGREAISNFHLENGSDMKRKKEGKEIEKNEWKGCRIEGK